MFLLFYPFYYPIAYLSFYLLLSRHYIAHNGADVGEQTIGLRDMSESEAVVVVVVVDDRCVGSCAFGDVIFLYDGEYLRHSSG